MKCSLCGFKFDKKDAGLSCAGCFLAKKCGLARCPNCGFEMAPDPEWIKQLKKRRKKDGINK